MSVYNAESLWQKISSVLIRTLSNVIQIGSASGPRIANDSGDCVIQDSSGVEASKITAAGVVSAESYFLQNDLYMGANGKYIYKDSEHASRIGFSASDGNMEIRRNYPNAKSIIRIIQDNIHGTGNLLEFENADGLIGTRIDTGGNLELLDVSVLGAESLNETDFATHAKWDVTGDFDDTGGNAAYTHNTGVGTLTQLAADLLTSGVADAWYIFEYDIAGAAGVIAAEVTTSFALAATSLDLTDGTDKTVLFKAAAAPTDFVVSATSSVGGAFALDNVSLKLVTRGDIAANGNIGVGGARGQIFSNVGGRTLYLKGADGGTAYLNLSLLYTAGIHSSGIAFVSKLKPYLGLVDLFLELQNDTYRIILQGATSQEFASFGVDTFRQLNNNNCGISRQINVSAETTLTGASVTVSNVAPQHARVIASGFIVSELITSGDGAVSWSLTYNAGAANQAIAAAQAFAKNTKGQIFFDTNANTDIASAQVDHVITPNANTFSGGKVLTFCIYEDLVAFDDIA